MFGGSAARGRNRMASAEENERATAPSGKYVWRIDRFSEKKNVDELCSETFTIGGCKWRIIVFPKGDVTEDHLSVYLQVADTARLPSGWCIEAKFALILVDQETGANSIRMQEPTQQFKSGLFNIQGFDEFKLLDEFLDCSQGYVVNDTVVIEAEITVEKVVPPIELATQISMLGSYFSSLSEYVVSAETSRDRLPVARQTIHLASDAPSAGDVEKAKQSLKECLSDLFKLDMRERLFSALTILSHPQAGLSHEHKRSIETFKANFDNLVWDFLTFEQDNSNFELQKFARDQMYSEMKKNHDAHLAYQSSFDSIAEEKEELNKRLKELITREAKIVCDWEALMNESENVKSGYAMQEKKLAEALEKKKIAEERMSRSTSAWSSLKELFL